MIFLDDSPQNLKPAKEMGMTTILVKSPITALKDLKELTGINVSFDNSCCKNPSYLEHHLLEFIY